MKPKKPQPKNTNAAQVRDLFQTPDYATDLIVPYISGTIWECAAGMGFISKRLFNHGFDVISSDIQTGQNFFTYQPGRDFDMIVTNPPYSLKEEFYKRCMSFGKPFALLVPADLNQWNLRATLRGAQWLIPTRRIDYITPNGKSGKDSSAQFHSGWFTYGLNLPDRITIVELELGIKQGNVPLFAQN